MIPKKASKLYKEVAEELDVEETLVEDLTEFLYKKVRQHLSNLTYPRINVEGLGHFMTKPIWVQRSIERSRKQLTTHDTSTFGAYSKKVRVQEKLDLLIELEKKILLEDQRKEKFKLDKDEYTKTNLEGEI